MIKREMEERKAPGLPGSSGEKEVRERSPELGPHERHFEWCGPGPGSGRSHLRLALSLSFAQVVVQLRTPEGYGCPEQRTLGSGNMQLISQLAKGLSHLELHANEWL